MLRNQKDRQFGFKKDQFVRDNQAYKKLSVHVNLPPINHQEKKLFRSFLMQDAQSTEVSPKKSSQKRGRPEEQLPPKFYRFRRLNYSIV